MGKHRQSPMFLDSGSSFQYSAHVTMTSDSCSWCDETATVRLEHPIWSDEIACGRHADVYFFYAEPVTTLAF